MSAAQVAVLPVFFYIYMGWNSHGIFNMYVWQFCL